MSDVTQADAGEKRTAVAKREWINAAGVECEENLATGFRYTHIASGEAFDRQFSLGAGSAESMLTIFGALTLAGNVVNTWNFTKGEKPDSPVLAIRERFEDLDKGVWVERTGGFAPRYDLDVLAEALAAVTKRDKAEFVPKLAADAKYKLGNRDVLYPTFAMSNDAVKAAYYSRKAATTPVDAAAL